MQYLYLFDFDYTLADSSQGVIECVKYAFSGMGLKEPDDNEICKSIGMSLDNAFIRLSGLESESLISQFKELFKKRADEKMADLTFLYDTVIDTSKELKNNGHLLGVVSTKFRYRIESVLKREGILDLFDVIIGGEDVINHKPHPEGIFKAVEKTGVSLSQCIYVGDSIIDAETAENAKVFFVASLTGTTKREEFDGYPVKYFIKEMQELSSGAIHPRAYCEAL